MTEICKQNTEIWRKIGVRMMFSSMSITLASAIKRHF